jgi:hypothetical protein
MIARCVGARIPDPLAGNVRKPGVRPWSERKSPRGRPKTICTAGQACPTPDGGYAGQLIDWVKEKCGWVLEIVKRTDEVKGFQVLPHRWVVERTFGWLGRYRRLSKDYEGLPETSEAMIYATMTHLMVRRLARKNLASS